MALPNPTSLVSGALTITMSDISSGATILSRIVPPAVFKAVNVQYQGNVALPSSTSLSFSPVPPVTLFSVAYVRNLGGVGSGNIVVQWTPSGGAQIVALNLDVGAMFLYLSPALSPVTISGIAPGLSSLIIQAGATTSSNLEVLMAG